MEVLLKTPNRGSQKEGDHSLAVVDTLLQPVVEYTLSVGVLTIQCLRDLVLDDKMAIQCHMVKRQSNRSYDFSITSTTVVWPSKSRFSFR